MHIAIWSLLVLDFSGSSRWLLLGGLLLIIVILTVVIAVQPARPSGRLVLLPTATSAATATARPVPVTVSPPATPVCGLPQASWPRPAGDNGRGVHWCPSTRHATASTERLVGAARELHLKWVLLIVGLDSWNFQEQYVREDAALIRALQGAGIMPIVRLGGQVGADDLAAFRRQVQTLSKLGVRYYQIGNEPNRADENGGRPPDPVAYVQWWLPRAQIVTQLGGYPGLGGWTRAESVAILRFCARRCCGCGLWIVACWRAPGWRRICTRWDH